MNEPNDLTEARGWIGRQWGPERTHIGVDDIRRFSFATREDDPVHFDTEAAQRAGHDDVVASPLAYMLSRFSAFCLGPREALGQDGATTGDVPPMPYERVMAGTIDIELGAPVRAGDVIDVTKTLTSITPREGSSGPFVVVEYDYEFRNQSSELVARETFSRVAR